MNYESPVTQLTKELVSINSVTPDDKGCQSIIARRLEHAGFKIKKLKFGDVDNLWAIRGGSGPIFCFAGHTDVVPPGKIEQWTNDPFDPVIINQILYGRGAADMKGSLAAMIVATEEFINEKPSHSGRLAFLITSDEEGEAKNGTVKVVEWLSDNDLVPSWCLVGEPTSEAKCGDTIKNGRRGSLNAQLTCHGIQGHVAYPEKSLNPIHSLLPALTELTMETWDRGNIYFPATSLQISNIKSGTGATNVVPGSAEVAFNFRYSTEVTDQQLKERVTSILDKHNVHYSLDWTLSGQPFLTSEGVLIKSTVESIFEITGFNTQLSTSGGTSDGRFFAPSGTEVVELGPVNESIHKVDENISIQDLDILSEIYKNLLIKILN